MHFGFIRKTDETLAHNEIGPFVGQEVVIFPNTVQQLDDKRYVDVMPANMPNAKPFSIRVGLLEAKKPTKKQPLIAKQDCANVRDIEFCLAVYTANKWPDYIPVIRGK